MPLFQGLCRPCNSGKGRRLDTDDIDRLLAEEQKGQTVSSRHIQQLWDQCKQEVGNNLEARELSNQLRINQHHYLLALHELRNLGYSDVLMSFLEPKYSRYTYEFEGVDEATLSFDRMVQSERNATYAKSRGSRIVRIAFDALEQYAESGARNVSKIESSGTQSAWSKVVESLDTVPAANQNYRHGLTEALDQEANNRTEQMLRTLFDEYGYNPPEQPTSVVTQFYEWTDILGEALAERYRRRI